MGTKAEKALARSVQNYRFVNNKILLSVLVSYGIVACGTESDTDNLLIPNVVNVPSADDPPSELEGDSNQTDSSASDYIKNLFIAVSVPTPVSLPDLYAGFCNDTNKPTWTVPNANGFTLTQSNPCQPMVKITSEYTSSTYKVLKGTMNLPNGQVVLMDYRIYKRLPPVLTATTMDLNENSEWPQVVLNGKKTLRTIITNGNHFWTDGTMDQKKSARPHTINDFKISDPWESIDASLKEDFEIELSCEMTNFNGVDLGPCSQSLIMNAAMTKVTMSFVGESYAFSPFWFVLEDLPTPGFLPYEVAYFLKVTSAGGSSSTKKIATITLQ